MRLCFGVLSWCVHRSGVSLRWFRRLFVLRRLGLCCLRVGLRVGRSMTAVTSVVVAGGRMRIPRVSLWAARGLLR